MCYYYFMDSFTRQFSLLFVQPITFTPPRPTDQTTKILFQFPPIFLSFMHVKISTWHNRYPIFFHYRMCVSAHRRLKWEKSLPLESTRKKANKDSFLLWLCFLWLLKLNLESLSIDFHFISTTHKTLWLWEHKEFG